MIVHLRINYVMDGHLHREDCELKGTQIEVLEREYQIKQEITSLGGAIIDWAGYQCP